MDTIAIKNIDNYTARMTGSVKEKLFFLHEIDPLSIDGIVDFGCADGYLLQTLKGLGLPWGMVGIDADQRYERRFYKNNPDGEFICAQFPTTLSYVPSNYALNMSSVIHEVYSYMDADSISMFWNAVFGLGYKYIIIRDMITTDKGDEAVPLMDLIKLQNNERYRKAKEEYEAMYGPIIIRRDLYHFLLKYRYEENWDRELRENYLPLSESQLIEMIPEDYDIVYEKLYTNEFIQNQVADDFGIQLHEPTHIQLILRRNDYLYNEHEYGRHFDLCDENEEDFE